MITFLIIVLSLGLGVMLGSAYRQHKMIMQMISNPDEMIEAIHKIKNIIEEAEDESDPNKIEAYAEQHRDRWFIYEKETNRFLAQGESLMQALVAAKDRFPDKIIDGVVEG